MIKKKSIAIAKERVKEIDDILKNMADMIKNKRIHIRSFWAATALHLQNYYLTRDEIISYLESKGFEEDHPKVKKYFPKKYLVDKSTGEICRRSEYWESVEGYENVPEYRLDDIDV